jgi:hypothetical protein
MTVHGYATGDATGPDGYYRQSAVMLGRIDRPLAGTSETENERPPAEQRADAYIPSNREYGEADLETPRAARGAQNTVRDHYGYCGRCSDCRANDAAPHEAETGSIAERDESARHRAAENVSRENDLSADEQRQVEELRQSDREIRAHEQAHAAAGATRVRYDYQVGPDGVSYAVGGSADIDIHTSSGDPDSTIYQARRMRAAALAPADPSAQDMAVAAKASRIENEAQAAKAEAARENNHPAQSSPGFFAVA